MSFDPNIRALERVNDILSAIALVEGYVEGFSQAKFVNDSRSVSAVAYQLIIIGEASNRLPAETRDRHPDVPWRQVIGMRNFLAHEYGRVAPAVVWEVATCHLASLRAAMVAERNWLASL